MNPGLALSIFVIVFVAELPDKTALASLVLATRYRPLQVFAGAAAAFVIQSLVAVAVGSLVSLFPQELVHRVAGALFLLFAVLMWLRKEEEQEAEVKAEEQTIAHFFKGAWASFLVVFLAEWGDLTQLATATLQAKYNDPVTVFVGATLALWAVSGLAILLGNRAGAFFKPELTQKIAAVIFAILGVLLIVGII